MVREKLDGSCVSVADVGGALYALGRAVYPVSSSLHEHVRLFEGYVARRNETFRSLLGRDERVVGEWLAAAHGTLYNAGHPDFSPFVAFDIFRNGLRILAEEFSARCAAAGVVQAKTIHAGEVGLPVHDALERLGPFGFHGAAETVEGTVWRVERDGKVEFLAKYVRPDKVDGKYRPGTAGDVAGGRDV